MQLHIENMTCGGCVRGVTRAVLSVDANAQVNVNLDSKQVNIVSDAKPDDIVAALNEAGFAPQQ